MSFFKKLGGALAGAAGGFLSGGIPGAIVGGLSGYQADKAARQQADAQAQAMQTAQGGIDAQVQAQREGLAAGLSGQQISYDLMRHHQEQQMPWRQASIGALQTLPVLQQALGLPSYQIPDNLQGLPEVNFMQQFNQALGQYGVTGEGGINSAPAGMDTGVRVTPASTFVAQGDSTSLAPAAPGLFNMEASPLYNWQKKEVTESLRNQLAALGLGQSTYGQREESRMRESLAAHERDRQIRDMFQMVNIGLGGLPQPTGAEMMPAQAGAGAAQSHANVGAIQGQGMMGMAQMGLDASTARAAQAPSWMQGLQVAGMFKNMNPLSGVFGSKPVPTFAPMNRAANQTMEMMGVPIPLFN